MKQLKKKLSIKLLILMLFSTSLTFGDGGGISYCDKKKYYDLVMVKFFYKNITLKSLKVNGAAAEITSIPNKYYFHEKGQLFQRPNQSFDDIGEISFGGQTFEKIVK